MAEQSAMPRAGTSGQDTTGLWGTWLPLNDKGDKNNF